MYEDPKEPQPQPPSHHNNRWYKRNPEAERPLPMQAPKATPKIPTWSPTTRYLFETIGRNCILFGGAGLMISTSFWWPSIFIILGLLLWLIDPWIEPTLRMHRPIIKLLFSSPFAFFLICFGWIIFSPAPLPVHAKSYVGDHVQGSPVGKIIWQDGYSELTVTFETPNSKEYTDIDFVIMPYDAWVADSDVNFPYCSTFNTPTGNNTAHASTKDASGKTTDMSTTGENKNGDMRLLTGGVRLICSKVPKGTVFTVTIAVTTQEAMADIAKGKIVFTGSKVRPTKVRIDGEFNSLGGRPNGISDPYPVEQIN